MRLFLYKVCDGSYCSYKAHFVFLHLFNWR
nr:MAG TPA: hypothetical protein [Caudoviricetes sp.]